ncbi:DUF7322 domain-containing protein [Halococcus hamelinensis]|uniref:DUF7322 domain-containing protein n=1 Tax=Halococcus hamelinensis 100A6 TaxID=1132509 RepID=M0LWH1_9EURY|nr:hypothetical protein [Halococcus hamelinensis]EMA36709.1 hypothetical protein C447_13919 [Halococcus hamelinensis 100A6]
MFDGLLGGSTTDPDDDAETSVIPGAPSVDVPDTSDVEVPPEVSHLFWSLVVSVDIAVLLVALGGMFIYFEGRWQLGGVGIVLGLFTLGYAYLKYRVAEPLTDRAE